MSGFPIHLITMLRMCGAQSLPLPIPISNIFVGRKMLMPTVEGGVDTDNLLGALIAQSGSNVFLGNMRLPAIAAVKDMASTDVRGLIPHITGLPIPVQGENSVRIGSGSAVAGIGMMQQLGLGSFGALSIGELVAIGGQIMGMVQNFTQLGGGAAVAQLSNLQGTPMAPGTTVIGLTSGYKFTFANYFDTRVMTGDYAYPNIDTVSDTIIQTGDDYTSLEFFQTDSGDYLSLDDGTFLVYDDVIDTSPNYIVIDDYFTFYPTLNLTASAITAGAYIDTELDYLYMSSDGEIFATDDGSLITIV